MENLESVLDKGYVRLVDSMGTDLTVVNAAKVSYDRQSTEWGSKEARLLSFLAREDHTSPFRHCIMQFEVYAPLMIARQWWKYVVGSAHHDVMVGWNESSRRYITEENEYYLPSPVEWRSKPENSKQGSGEPLGLEIGSELYTLLSDYQIQGERLYQKAMERNVAPELARLFLPAYGIYVRWYWTASLQGVAHFLKQRLAHDSQFEIQQYAKAVESFARELYPHSIKELLN